jgi:hypothetical protein
VTNANNTILGLLPRVLRVMRLAADQRRSLSLNDIGVNDSSSVLGGYFVELCPSNRPMG